MPARIIDVNTIIQAGINPKTGLPIKLSTSCTLKDDLKRALRIVDEQDAINRYVWYNLPDGLDGQLLERILYYRGQGMFFYLESNTTFYFLPYALDGEIDVYGRYTGVTPLPFNGQAKTTGKEKPWILGLRRKPVYGIKIEELKYKDLTESCVLLSDYCKQISQTTLSRQMLNDPILDLEAEILPFMRTALQNQTGVTGVRVNNEDEQSNVEALNEQMNLAALSGKKFLATVGTIEQQPLTEGAIGRPDSFMQALESVDNFRLGLYGIENGGLFQKKAHMLESEQAMASGGSTGLVYQDGLTIRQHFCDIVNSIWGLGIWCDASENQVGDMNGDSIMQDDSMNGAEGSDDGGMVNGE